MYDRKLLKKDRDGNQNDFRFFAQSLGVAVYPAVSLVSFWHFTATISSCQYNTYKSLVWQHASGVHVTGFYIIH